jgi:hypothetical protein
MGPRERRSHFHSIKESAGKAAMFALSRAMVETKA